MNCTISGMVIQAESHVANESLHHLKVSNICMLRSDLEFKHDQTAILKYAERSVHFNLLNSTLKRFYYGSIKQTFQPEWS